jgi:predicted phage baseplate assembly protein
MTSLRTSLDDTDFTTLVETARSFIPAVAPEWTDHNLHDPGIMLLDLLAWSADQEIYALGRDRLDERLGYAALLALRPSGPSPARGLIWPVPDAQTATAPPAVGTYVTQDGVIAPTSGEAPPTFIADHSLYLTTAHLVGLDAVSPDGESRDLFPLERPAGSPMLPFGDDPRRGARLEFRLEGALAEPVAAHQPSANRRLILSIGFRVDDPSAGTAAPTEIRRGRLRARLRAELEWPGGIARVPIVHDQTSAFARSGVLLLDLAQLPAHALRQASLLRLTLSSAALPMPPRLSAVGLNVIPVRQENRENTADFAPPQSNGLPDQEVALAEGICFGTDVAIPRVTVTSPGQADEWTICADFADAGPQDRVFVFDAANGFVRFGNGVNGAIPPAGSVLAVSYVVSDGAAGNLPAGTSWKVPGVAGEFRNPEPMRGGADRTDVADLRQQAHERVAGDRPIVTNADLEAAALACADLRVARARAIAGFDPDRRSGRAGRTRTLVVVRSDAGSRDGESETGAWLQALRRRLALRFLLGDRVRIVGPRYVPLFVRATLAAVPGRDAVKLAAKAMDLLRKQLSPVPTGEGSGWGFGRAVQAHDLMGWLRKLEGVAAVRDLRIGTTRSGMGAAPVALAPHGLPLLQIATNDIVVVGTAGGRT